MKFENKIGVASILTLTCLIISIQDARSEQPVKFLMIGDLPYVEDKDNTQEDYLRDTIKPRINQNFPFVIHIGDFKGSSETCDNDTIRERFDQAMRLSPGLVFFTPGDNDWTDCDEYKLSERYFEAERLDFLISLIQASRPKPPQVWNFKTQPRYPENARWMYKNVLFATVHVVGTNNGRKSIHTNWNNNRWNKESLRMYPSGEEWEDYALERVIARDHANEFWILKTFLEAERINADAVVLAMHGDIVKNTDHFGKSCERGMKKCDAFMALRKQLVTLASRFNELPVLIAHGSTNPFCLSNPAFKGGGRAKNLWRLNILGDYKVDGTVVTIKADNKDRPFEATPLTSNEQLEGNC